MLLLFRSTWPVGCDEHHLLSGLHLGATNGAEDRRSLGAHVVGICVFALPKATLRQDFAASCVEVRHYGQMMFEPPVHGDGIELLFDGIEEPYRLRLILSADFPFYVCGAGEQSMSFLAEGF